MIYCTRCGTPCDDTDRFCSRCGAPLASPAGEASAAAGPQASARPAQPVRPARPFVPVSPAVDLLRQKGRSGRMLAAAAALTAALLFSLFTVADSGSALLSMAQRLTEQPGLGALAAWVDSIPGGFSLATRLVGLAYTALFLAGVWMLWAACGSADAPKTGGAALIQVLVIIRLALSCLLFLVLEGGLLMLAQEAGSGVLVAVAVVAAGVFALILLYYVAILSILSAVRRTARDHAPHVPGFTPYLTAINILAAVGAFIGGVASGSVFALLGGVANAVFLILISVLAFDYRSGMLELESHEAD